MCPSVLSEAGALTLKLRATGCEPGTEGDLDIGMKSEGNGI